MPVHIVHTVQTCINTGWSANLPSRTTSYNIVPAVGFIPGGIGGDVRCPVMFVLAHFHGYGKAARLEDRLKASIAGVIRRQTESGWWHCPNCGPTHEVPSKHMDHSHGVKHPE
jgi:hypothetical protein